MSDKTKTKAIDLAKANIEFPLIGKGLQRQIMIDGVEWGSVWSTPEGRHGSKFGFKDAANVSVRYAPLPHRSGFRVPPARYYEARAKNKASVDEALRTTVVAMITAGALKSPDEVRTKAEEAKGKRQKEIDNEIAEKRARWEAQAMRALVNMKGYVMTGEKPHPEDIDAVIEAMEWAQGQ